MSTLQQFNQEEKCVGCGGSRSSIYPRDCNHCGGLFIPDQRIYPREEKWKRLRKLLSCDFCPPNQHENAKRKSQFGKKFWCWKFRNKNKKQYE